MSLDDIVKDVDGLLVRLAEFDPSLVERIRDRISQETNPLSPAETRAYLEGVASVLRNLGGIS